MKKKVLVIDDNGSSLMLAKDLLDDVNPVKLE
jgi:hypoxanthine phosphoribosyltransferase